MDMPFVHPLPTPPTSQNNQAEHDPKKDIGHGAPLVPLGDENLDQPLFHSGEEQSASVSSTISNLSESKHNEKLQTELVTRSEIVTKLSLPPPFEGTFNRDRFSKLVEHIAKDRSGLRKYAKSDITVTVSDPHFFQNAARTVSFRSVWLAARGFIDFEIPTAEPRFGRDVADRVHSCMRSPWFEAYKLAFRDELKDIPSGQPETFQKVMEQYRKATFRPLEDISTINKRVIQRPTIPIRRTEPATLSITRAEVSAITPDLPTTRPTRKASKDVPPVVESAPQTTKKRKESPTKTEETAVKKKAKKGGSKAHTRNAPGMIHKDGDSQSPNFGRRIKTMLNHRSGIKDAKQYFEDAVKLMPEDGEHLPEITRFRKIESISLDKETYETQKRRMFIGVVLLLEQNVRLERQNAKIRAQGGKNIRRLFPLGKSAVQNYASMDVNKMSRMYELFAEFPEWLPRMVLTTKGVESVNPWYLEKYPEEVRKPFFDELIEWENQSVDPSIYVVERE